LIRAVAFALILGAGPALAQDPVLIFSGPSGTLDLDLADLADAKAERFATLADVTVTLTPDAGQRLADFTAANLGEEIKVIACDTVIFAPRIVEPIKGGSLTIGGLSQSQGLALHEILTGQSSCNE
jgi:preprotein translocase subunit SecD